MPIPPLDEAGLLPPGVHDCTMEEVEQVFARFQRSDQRIRLFEKLKAYLKEVRSTGFAVALLIDGSFVTSKEEPEDIDLILVLKPDHDFSANLRPFEYNVVSKRRVRQNYRFDLLVAGQDSPQYFTAIEFFQQVRNQSEVRKGILRVLVS
jgi:hypothetical protein